MPVNITEEYLPPEKNPDYMTARVRIEYIQGLGENEKAFRDLSNNAQNVFNHILATEPKRCFYRYGRAWFPCFTSPYVKQTTTVVRLDVPQEPAEAEILADMRENSIRWDRLPQTHRDFVRSLMQSGESTRVWHGESQFDESDSVGEITNSMFIVVDREEPKPEYKELGITIVDGAYIFVAPDGEEYFAHDAVGFVGFACYVKGKDKTYGWYWNMDDSWNVRVKI